MDISKLTVASASASLSKGEFSSVELTKAVIEAVDNRDGDICAYLTFDRDGALRQAAEADAARAAGKEGPLLGISPERSMGTPRLVRRMFSIFFICRCLRAIISGSSVSPS